LIAEIGGVPQRIASPCEREQRKTWPQQEAHVEFGARAPAPLVRHGGGVVETFNQLAARRRFFAANCMFSIAHGCFLIDETDASVEYGQYKGASPYRRCSAGWRISSIFGPFASMPIFSS
jgi:hypothetical protein